MLAHDEKSYNQWLQALKTVAKCVRAWAGPCNLLAQTHSAVFAATLPVFLLSARWVDRFFVNLLHGW